MSALLPVNFPASGQYDAILDSFGMQPHNARSSRESVVWRHYGKGLFTVEKTSIACRRTLGIPKSADRCPTGNWREHSRCDYSLHTDLRPWKRLLAHLFSDEKKLFLLTKKNINYNLAFLLFQCVGKHWLIELLARGIPSFVSNMFGNCSEWHRW